MFELRIWDTGNLCNFPYLPEGVKAKTGAYNSVFQETSQETWVKRAHSYCK